MVPLKGFDPYSSKRLIQSHKKAMNIVIMLVFYQDPTQPTDTFCTTCTAWYRSVIQKFIPKPLESSEVITYSEILLLKRSNCLLEMMNPGSIALGISLLQVILDFNGNHFWRITEEKKNGRKTRENRGRKIF
jgi:hypothetical protein